MIIVATVAVVPTVGFVVLIVVGNKVSQGETIVAAEEVDRRSRPAPSVEVGRTLDTLGHRAHQAHIALEEAAHIVAVFAVPLGPAPVGGERTDLIQPASVPGFGDQLALCQNRIVSQCFQQRRIRQRNANRVAPQNRSEVEAEAVNVILGSPIAQAVEHHVAYHRVIAVQRIAGAAEVPVVALRGEHVVGFVVNPPERDRRPLLVPLGGVVKHHIKQHLNAVAVQFLD